MLSILKKISAVDFAAVVLAKDDISVVGVARSAGERPRMSVCEHITVSADDKHKREKLLKSKLREYKLDINGLSTTLGLGEYSLLIIDAPDVPANELRAAVRWQIRDLINFHIDDAILDIFDAPAQSNGQQRKIYVVVTRKSHLEGALSLFHRIDANLTVVDIPELSLRNLASGLPENEQGMVFLYFTEKRGVLTLIRQNTLYLARSLDFGISSLAVWESTSQLEVVERLGLEVQRSLDYYDRYFDQSPIQYIVISPMQDVCPELCSLLQKQLGLQTRYLSLSELVDFDNNLDSATQRRILLPLGAALRVEEKTL